MNTSSYQHFKIKILSLVPLSKDAIHIYIGLVALFTWALLFRKSLKSFKTLIPAILLAAVMELLDLRDDFNSIGHFRWEASLHDILNTLFWPFFIVLLFKLGLIKSK